MAELAPRHVAVERRAVELETRGEALDDRDQAGAMRFACSCEPQGHAGSVDGDDFRPRAQGCGANVAKAPRARNGAKGIVRLRASQPWRASSARPATDPAAKATTIASITPAPR